MIVKLINPHSKVLRTLLSVSLSVAVVASAFGFAYADDSRSLYSEFYVTSPRSRSSFDWTGFEVSGIGKNLLPNNYQSLITPDYSFVVNSDGSVTFSGTFSYNTGFTFASSLPLDNASYTLSGCPSGGGYSSYILAVNESSDSSNTTIYADTGSGVTFDVSSGSVYRPRIIVFPGTYSSVTVKPMIRYSYLTNSLYLSYRNNGISVLDGIATVTDSSVINGNYRWDFAYYPLESGNTYTVSIPYFEFPNNVQVISTPDGQQLSQDELPYISSFVASGPYMPYFYNDSSRLSGFENGDTFSLPITVTCGDFAPSSSSFSNFSLKNGYLAVFDLSNNHSFTLDFRSTSLVNSDILGNFNNANQSYWFSDSLPDSSTSFPSDHSQLIPWTKSAPFNLLGQSKNMKATVGFNTSSRYLYVFNPAGYFHPELQGIYVEGMNSNNDVIISDIPSNIDVYIYNTTNIQDVTKLGNVSGTISGDSGLGTSTSSGGAIDFTDTSSGDPYVQTSGGDTTIDQAADNVLEQLKQVLVNFTNRFTELFTAPVEYISNLIDSGSAFMHSLSGIYTWLPSPVSSIITSGLVLLVVIGVLKLLL